MIGLHSTAAGRPSAAFPHDAARLDDGALLARFSAARDRDALEQIVRRHGPMVLGVCRRVLGDGPDADDAFQATFLVFVRKGATLRRPGLVANWLYGVALRVARKARAVARRRRHREEPMIDLPAPTRNRTDADLRRVLDKELNRLPEKYRAPVVLCHLEGHTLDEAARILGWPKGTVAGRLSRARERLRNRLTRHGVAVTPLSLDLTFAQQASASVLAESHVQSAVGALLNSQVSKTVLTLADSVQRDAFWGTVATVVLVIYAVLVGSAGTAATISACVNGSGTHRCAK